MYPDQSQPAPQNYPTPCWRGCKGTCVCNAHNPEGGAGQTDAKNNNYYNMHTAPGVMYAEQFGQPPATTPAAVAPWRERRAAAANAANPAPISFAPAPTQPTQQNLPPATNPAAVAPWRQRRAAAANAAAPAPAPISFAPAPTPPTYQNLPPPAQQNLPPAAAPAAVAPWRQRKAAAANAAAPAPISFAPAPTPTQQNPPPATTPALYSFPLAPPQPTQQNPPVQAQPMPSRSDSNDPILQWINTRPVTAPSSNKGARGSRVIPQHVASLEFRWSDVNVMKALGAGSFGKVFLAEVQHTPLAVKVLVDAQAVTAASIAVGSGGRRNGGKSPAHVAMDAAFSPTTATTDQLVKEVSALAPLRHPNVVALAGFCLEPPCLAMEYCSRGSLQDLLTAGALNYKQDAYLTWQRRLSMAADGASGMLHLHTRSPPVLHRDVKSSNLLVANDWTLKIAGVGLSKAVSEATGANTAGGGTDPRFLAPEVLNGDNATSASDVFSYGICLWQLLTMEKPYGGITVWKIVGKITQGERPPLPALHDLPGFGAQRPSPQSLDAYIGLMNRCWAQDPRARPTFDVVASELRALLRAETGGHA